MPLKSILALSLSATTLLLLGYLYWQPDAPAPRQAADPVEEVEDYADRDWTIDRLARLNISLFTFNDMNRNGRYDWGDHPLGSIVVRLGRPDGSTIRSASNINGYANFEMLLGEASADVSSAGDDYQFDVSVPPGWKITTGNPSQMSRFTDRPGSPAGLAAETPPAVVGLMQDLTVSGSVAGAVDGELVITAMGPDGQQQEVAVDGQQEFNFNAHPGAWSLEVVDVEAGLVSTTRFQVDSVPVRLATIDLAQARPAPLPFPVVEDFEYLVRAKIDKLPGGRSGLGWDFLLAIDNQHYGGPGYANGLRSGRMVGYNSSGHPVTVVPDEGEESFDFVGAYFTVAWPAAQGEQLLVQAWRQGQLVATEELSLSYLGPVWFQADYHRIDKLRLSSVHNWQFVTDDMRFRVKEKPKG